MSLLKSVLNRFGYVGREDFEKFKRDLKTEISGVAQRSYSAAGFDRLVNDWLTPGTSGDMENRTALRTVRNRSREAERNDDYMLRYLNLRENNVLGHLGIGLQMKVEKSDGSLNKDVNQAIEDAWAKWGRADNCTVAKDMTWRGVQEMVLRSQSRDGFILVRDIVPAPNDFFFSLQPLEGDHLDIDYTKGTTGGNEIRMGVERNDWGDKVAFHILKYHPGDYVGSTMQAKRERIPAENCLLIQRKKRVSETVAMPETAASLRGMKMLHGYHEAELIAAREAACKGYFLKKATPEAYGGEQDAQGRSIQDIEPGMGIEGLPGEEYVPIDPQHPVQAFPDFVKSILRGVAAGLGVSYNSLANDLEGVNYSSIRAGLLDEREEWKATQQWLIEDFIQPVFEKWLRHCLTWGLIVVRNKPLTILDFDRVNKPDWKPRRWDWVDPEKDMKANVLAVEKGFNSRRRIIAEAGGDVEEIFKEQKEDQDLAKEYELEFPIEGTTKSPGEEGAKIPEESSSAPANGGGGRLLGLKRLLAGLHDS